MQLPSKTGHRPGSRSTLTCVWQPQQVSGLLSYLSDQCVNWIRVQFCQFGLNVLNVASHCRGRGLWKMKQAILIFHFSCQRSKSSAPKAKLGCGFVILICKTVAPLLSSFTLMLQQAGLMTLNATCVIFDGRGGKSQTRLQQNGHCLIFSSCSRTASAINFIFLTASYL